MATVLGANTLAAGGFDVANSCRFNDGSNDNLSKTFDAQNTRTKHSISFWCKRATLGHTQFLFEGSDGTYPSHIYFSSGNALAFYDSGENATFVTTALFRDSSAWMHILCRIDTTQAANANRVRFYVNGVLSATAQTNAITQGGAISIAKGVVHTIGKRIGATDSFDGYFCEFIYVYNVSHEPTAFGEFNDDGIWIPLDGLADSLTFGNNGFYLDFQDSSALGNDVSGNNTDFAANNLAAVDQSTDTCTNNFATMNPLDNFRQVTAFTEGNCKLVYTSGNRTWNTATVALSSGKWYVEILKGATEHDTIGIHYKLSAALTDRPDSDAGAWSFLGGKEYDDGGVKENGSTITYTIAPSDSGDIVGMYLDLDNNKLYFAVNGAIGRVGNAGTGITIPAASTLENGHYYIFGGSDNASATMTHSWNFGNPIVALSSAVSDANGFGSFEYTPSGTFDGASKDFLAICSKNLAENS